jgi:hypothetical protein
MKNFHIVFLLVFGAVYFSSCDKKTTEPIIDDSIDPLTSNTIQVTVSHNWADVSNFLVLSQDYVHPVTGETVNFQSCNYYLTNFQFKKADGTWWVHPFSYNLVRVTSSHTFNFSIPDVPFETYDAVRFLIGVDSAKNVSGAQAGDLAPSNAMFWSWSTGYIMIKLEGNSTQANWEYFSFHIGGFRDIDETNATRWVEMDLSDTPLQVSENKSPKLKLHADISKAWTMENKIADNSILHTAGEMARLMADQFKTAFSLDGVE